MTYDVQLIQAVASPLAVIRRVAPQNELSRVVPQLCGEVWNFVRAASIPNPGRHVAIYYDCQIRLEVGVEVAGPFAGDGHVVYSTTPAGPAATCAHFGPYGLLGGAHAAIQDFCRARKLELAGPNWEIYGHPTADVSQTRTDVFYLIKDAP